MQVEDILKQIPQLPQRQDGQINQMRDLLLITNRLGMNGEIVDLITLRISDYVRDAKLVMYPWNPNGAK